ncbi:MAG: T9SS type A sorting domain-containing protein [Saprospiraceae bacterium]
MKKSLLLLAAFYLSTSALFAQTDRAIYGSVQEPIVGVAITSTGTVYSFPGFRNSGADQNFFPDTLSLEGVNGFDRQENSPLGGQTTLDSWLDPSTNMYYQLELLYFNCDAGFQEVRIISFPKNDPSQVDTAVLVHQANWGVGTQFVVAGDRYAILEESILTTAKFTDLSDTTMIFLQNPILEKFTSRATTIGDVIYVSDGTKILSIDNNADVTEVSINEPIIGLGTHGSFNPDVYAVCANAAYKFNQGVVFDTLAFDESYAFESLIMNAHGTRFLCTYSENGGSLRYGVSSGFSTIGITSYSRVDGANPGRFVEYLQTSTSEVGNARSVAVLEFERTKTSILLSTQNEFELVDLEEADVDLVGVEMGVEYRTPTYQYFYAKPTIRNNSTDTIESLQLEGEFFISNCSSRNTVEYTDLGILPGEERQLDSIEIASPALGVVGGNTVGRLNLSSANNFPIKEGNSRTATGIVTFSSAPEAYAKTVSAYPNPAQSTVQVELPEGAILSAVTATDLLGREVTQLVFNGGIIDVSNLISGAYLLELQLKGDKLLYARVVKP